MCTWHTHKKRQEYSSNITKFWKGTKKNYFKSYAIRTSQRNGDVRSDDSQRNRTFGGSGGDSSRGAHGIRALTQQQQYQST